MAHTIWLYLMAHLIGVGISAIPGLLLGAHAIRLHTKSARLNEAVAVGSTFALALIQKRMTPEVAAGVRSLLDGGSSMAAVGAYLLGHLGKPLLADFLAGWATLAEAELPILFGSTADVETEALRRLGVAAAHEAGTEKKITTTADGTKVVSPA